MKLDTLNFVLTNRIPRVYFTRQMRWLSQVQSPWLTRLVLKLWGAFAKLETEDTVDGPFASVRDFFVRGLKPNARPVDPNLEVWVSPCDGLLGAHGLIEKGQALQIKGMPYSVAELLGSEELAQTVSNYRYTTVRLTSGMYHRFHAPCDLVVKQARLISGDVFNVNPPALKRIPSLFCRNERVVLTCNALGRDAGVLYTFYIVAVAAVLVASVRVKGLDQVLNCTCPDGLNFPMNLQAQRGEELGWFEQGSTLVVLTPPECTLLEDWSFGQRLRMGQALWHGLW